jgi:hypothetical protein
MDATYLRAWITVTNAHERGGGRTAEWYHIRRDNPVLPCFLSDVKLLRFGCRSSVCGLRRVSALLVFCSSFGSQNSVVQKSVCQNAIDYVEIKGEKCFQLHYTCSDRLSVVLLPLALSMFRSPLSDVAEARSYFASTVLCNVYTQRSWGM